MPIIAFIAYAFSMRAFLANFDAPAVASQLHLASPGSKKRNAGLIATAQRKAPNESWRS